MPMKHNYLFSSFFILLFIFITPKFLNAQEAVSSSGNIVLSSGGSVSYTVGQVIYTTLSSDQGVVTQGVQQPYEIYDNTSADDAINISLSVSVFPNPATDKICLEVKEMDISDLMYKLIALDGSTIIENDMLENPAFIDVEHLKPAIYYLQVNSNSSIVKVFQIIKK
jgi:hypothetical protein